MKQEPSLRQEDNLNSNIKNGLENILQSRIPSSGVHIHFIFGNVFINWNKIYNNNSIFSCEFMHLDTFLPTRLFSGVQFLVAYKGIEALPHIQLL